MTISSNQILLKSEFLKIKVISKSKFGNLFEPELVEISIGSNQNELDSEQL
jgi:hypothetical protein